MLHANRQFWRRHPTLNLKFLTINRKFNKNIIHKNVQEMLVAAMKSLEEDFADKNLLEINEGGLE